MENSGLGIYKTVKLRFKYHSILYIHIVVYIFYPVTFALVNKKR